MFSHYLRQQIQGIDALLWPIRVFIALQYHLILVAYSAETLLATVSFHLYLFLWVG